MYNSLRYTNEACTLKSCKRIFGCTMFCARNIVYRFFEVRPVLFDDFLDFDQRPWLCLITKKCDEDIDPTADNKPLHVCRCRSTCTCILSTFAEMLNYGSVFWKKIPLSPESYYKNNYQSLHIINKYDICKDTRSTKRSVVKVRAGVVARCFPVVACPVQRVGGGLRPPAQTVLKSTGSRWKDNGITKVQGLHRAQTLTEEINEWNNDVL